MKDKKPIAVGDRVRVYHRNVITGKVDTISPDGHIGVIEDGFYSQHDESPFHPKQCRRLKPRPAKEERERVELYVAKDTNLNVALLLGEGEGHVSVKRPLQVGDRVKVYGQSTLSRVNSNNAIAGWKGTVVSVFPEGVNVKPDAYSILADKEDELGSLTVNRRQCVHLRPRPAKEERGDWWVLRNIVDDSPGAFFSSRREAEGSSLFLKAGWELFHLVEQRENEVLVDRAKLAKAWDKNGSNKCIYPLHDHSEFFDMLCIAIGLPAKEPK